MDGKRSGAGYTARHAKRWYRVWRVLGPAGPVRTEFVLGRQEAEALCRGCWDWEINPIDDRLIRKALIDAISERGRSTR